MSFCVCADVVSCLDYRALNELLKAVEEVELEQWIGEMTEDGQDLEMTEDRQDLEMAPEREIDDIIDELLRGSGEERQEAREEAIPQREEEELQPRPPQTFDILYQCPLCSSQVQRVKQHLTKKHMSMLSCGTRA